MPKRKDQPPEQLPDGRKLCFRCRDYKGASFFSPKQWLLSGYKLCRKCAHDANVKSTSRIREKSGEADLRRADFLIKFSTT